ncbi:hypothetical protein SY83_01795 [Paenibacillus swuensis]|uniref:DUF2642 domain-containing protein n=1 Tax=Paenibacillus swuensis TaxID=1178515 RepID=A0A172TE32_9BACL|nr:hypothetical protein [Paenibacillus swuensis]ANE45270.1 hypothetical protein SY83_01795 [Paenibacillus swuensis]
MPSFTEALRAFTGRRAEIYQASQLTRGVILQVEPAIITVQQTPTAYEQVTPVSVSVSRVEFVRLPPI